MSFCGCCEAQKQERGRFKARPGELDKSGGLLSLLWDGAPLRLGDSVYLEPDKLTKKTIIGSKKSSDMRDEKQNAESGPSNVKAEERGPKDDGLSSKANRGTKTEEDS